MPSKLTDSPIPQLNKEEAKALEPLMQAIYRHGRLLTGLVIDGVTMPIPYLSYDDKKEYGLLYKDGELHSTNQQ